MLRIVPLAEIRNRKSSRCLVTRCTSDDAVRSFHSQQSGSAPLCVGTSKYAETRFWSRQGITVDVRIPSLDQLLIFGCITSTSEAPGLVLKAASAMKEQHAVVDDGLTPASLQLPAMDEPPRAHESQPG